MKKEHKQDSRAAKSHSKPDAKPGPTTASERPSRAIERAEGEGMVPHTQGAPKATVPAAGALEGEGSYSAARRYDEGVQRSVQEGDAAKLSEEAARALDGPEGAALRKAEQAAKHGHAA